MKIKNRSKKQFKSNVRFQALVILNQIEHQQGYSNLLIQDFLNQSPLSQLDDQLLVQLIYGVTQWRYRLDYYLEPFIQGKKIEEWIGTLLRLSVYQMVALDRIPDHAIIDQAVTIAKINGHQGLGNFVNAILRSIQRQGVRSTEEIEDRRDYLATHYSIEKWIVDLLIEQLGDERTEQVLTSLLERPYVSARVNTRLTNQKALISQLNSSDIEVTEGVLSSDGIRILKGNVVDSPEFEMGHLTVQDESSMLVAPLGKIQPSDTILDACSAPGGKTTHMAQYLNEGHIDALDISLEKLKKVEENAKRMHLDKWIQTYQADARTFEPPANKKYDVIYVDAPCSGLGLMRRKPEIKYTKTPADLKDLQKIQLAILNYLASHLKEGGRLIYSTCTITMEENERVLTQFLEQRDDFIEKPIDRHELMEPSLLTDEGTIRIWPDIFMTDGFFIARLEKKGK